MPQRVTVGWFQPKSPDLYSSDHFPAWILQPPGQAPLYGFPIVTGDDPPGFKIGSFWPRGVGTCDPDTVDRSWRGEEDERPLREAVERFFPGAAGPLVKGGVCMFANTPDGHFVVDQHPKHPQVRGSSAVGWGRGAGEGGEEGAWGCLGALGDGGGGSAGVGGQGTGGKGLTPQQNLRNPAGINKLTNSQVRTCVASLPFTLVTLFPFPNPVTPALPYLIAPSLMPLCNPLLSPFITPSSPTPINFNNPTLSQKPSPTAPPSPNPTPSNPPPNPCPHPLPSPSTPPTPHTPTRPNPHQVIICSACSGHGFKLSPAIGLVLAEMVRHGSSTTFDREMQIHRLDPTRPGHEGVLARF